ncbi:ubiquitin carboxyl-terminal hydrolase 43 isoform X1 [Cololabis saira]|uniref:ubiquitin carboxyl-terminal hydrolase 43 isoform X1 n=1 Tax=Cololabis saira TaxID=129043 RepID=UPI002AD42E2B|nr:ubiquitin carboxyl-terminal hydrolase 43 isoform X1 [Cololabis saira]XP_061567339.1 ubiquitin carboxyl-terminal hydrolase 43 isoform X1 [Cololabis saira]
MEKQGRLKEGMPTSKEDKRKDKKPKSGKLFRKKSLKSVGSFMNKIIKTLGTFTHFGDADAQDAEDDDGGFRNGAPCTLSASSGVMRADAQVAWDRAAKAPPSTSSSLSTWREKLLYQYGDKTPGVLGLKNHGNTCFMNAVVQCLSNTDLLAEYLGLERYRGHPGHPGDTRVNGVVSSDGEVTEQLASLVRALWTLEYIPQLSVDFKAVVSKYGSQFRGNSQHDALEFLLWLLDHIHEDVILASHNNNNQIKAPGKGPGGGEEVAYPDPIQSQQPNVQHSFVQEHFQAQYKSSLTCPHCLKQSNTFDPFLCISLPIPLRQTRPLCVTLVFSTKGQRYLRVGLAVPLFGFVACLRRMVADEGKLSPDQVILTEVYSTGFQRSFFDEDDLTSIAENDIIYAFQAPPLYIRGGSARISGYHHSLPSSPYAAGPEGQRLPSSGTLSSEFLNQGVPVKILLLVCNAAGGGQQTVRFGPPFLMREDRSISWDQLQQSILSKLYYLMINGAQAQNTRVLFNIRVVGGSAFYSYLSPQDGRPLYHPAVDRALKLCSSGGPPHVKLIIEWEHRIKDCLFGNIQEEVVKDAESARNLQQQHIQQYSCTLDECFQLYTKEEQLAPDDAWKCPHCKQLQQGVVKMSLWTLPDILILHLKRFRQVGERRNKLTTFVHFPLVDLDMTPHMVNRNSAPHAPPQQPPLQAGWKQPRRPDPAPPDFLYDLYAVCNHHGGMHGGHYTAFCRNSVDGQWYSYDDSNAEPVPEAEVCTRGAYILFYQKRNTIPPWSASSSVTGSTSSSISDHWLVRLTGGSKRGSLVSADPSSAPVEPAQPPESPEVPVFGDEPPKTVETDGSGASIFVRGTQGRSLSMRSPIKSKESLNKVLPLRWSFGSKDRIKHSAQTQSGELVEYLESGRRPRCTKEPIISLVATPPLRNAHGRVQEAGQDCSSPSGSSLSCTDRLSADACYSPKIPEGQIRPGSERKISHGARNESHVKSGVEDSLRLGSSKRAKSEQGRGLDFQLMRGAILGGHISYSAPPSRDSTLRSSKVQISGTPRGQRDLFQMTLQPEDRRGLRGEEGRSQDSLLSFFKPVLVKKEEERRMNGHGHLGKLAGSNLAKLSLSNGTLTVPVAEGRRGHSISSCDAYNCKMQLVNGRVRGHDPVDIKRAHSSSNIQTKLDLTFRRCASLQRNGEVAVPPPQRVPLPDKPGSATLQRPRYSSTSLGRHPCVPEACF